MVLIKKMYQDIDEDEFFDKRLPDFFQKYSDSINNNNMLNNKEEEFLEECKFIFGYLEYSFCDLKEEDMQDADPEKIKDFKELGKNLQIIVQRLNTINFDGIENKYKHLNDQMMCLSENMNYLKNFFENMNKETQELNNFMTEKIESLENFSLDLKRNIYLSTFIKELNIITNLTLLEACNKKNELIAKMKTYKYIVDPNVLHRPDHPYPDLDLKLEKHRKNKEISDVLFKFNLDTIIYILNKHIQRNYALNFDNINVECS